MSKNFYITTTLPYVNSEPHIGFAMEIIQADVVARAKKLQGFDVFFNTGTDEHGQKIYQKALQENKDPQTYTDEYAEKFRSLKELLNLSPDLHFIRTTDSNHKSAAQEFWKKCDASGDIYQKAYKIKYCVGCELEKTDSELVDGKCPIHPNKEIETIDETNYFFRFSKYGDKLLKMYEGNPGFMLPDFRLNEMRVMIKNGLEDFSISRLASKMPWGIPVPGDNTQVMYVWFDALVNYVSTIGWPNDLENFNKYWPVVQFAGKDQVRQQSAMWQAMLMSAGLPPSQKIVVHGFINTGGQKMSKSLGNFVTPVELINEYGVDVLRYYLTREMNQFEDSDFTLERFKDAYNANLANGLGNLVSRIMKMASDNLKGPVEISERSIPEEYFELLNNFEINKAVEYVWKTIGEMDLYIQENQPFKLIKTDKEAGQKMIKGLVVKLYTVARMLNPIMPETSTKIKELIKANRSPEAPLFLRKD
ncbi:MAG: methionyl-tRNA synthetase [Parcubacteria group bacterium Gr01-1014_46]|nr:MAG: methionyl-tRNA synthetase [Parcubacteria group bacterium Gr01-1014_46]